MARGEVAGLGAGAERVGRRVRLVLRARPDRHRAVLEMPALPAEGLRLGPRLEDQLHPLVGTFARFLRVQVVAQVFVGRPAQQADHDAPRRQRVEHRQFLGDADRIAGRHDRAEQGDLDRIDAGGEPGGGDHRRRRQDARRVVVLGDADPVEAERLDEFHPLDHAAIGFGSGRGVVGGGGHRPFARQVRRRDVAAGFEIRHFHGSVRDGLGGGMTALSSVYNWPFCRLGASGGTAALGQVREQWRDG